MDLDMNTTALKTREGGLEAPTRYPIKWREESFYDRDDLNKELERVYDICHGCRRCVSLCDAFPTLFDLVDESSTLEVDGVAKDDYYDVVDQCYLCDLCYQVKCPYVPPHEWALDFPHLMLRAKAKRFRDQGARMRDKLLSSTDTLGKINTLPVINIVARAITKNSVLRKGLEKTLGVHYMAPIPSYDAKTLNRRTKNRPAVEVVTVSATEKTRGKVALLPTCYCEFNEPKIALDLVTVLEHNEIEVNILEHKACCGMPKLELGDLKSIEALMHDYIPQLAELVAAGYDLIAPVPSCVVMLRNELPLLFPENFQVQEVAARIFDPFEYLSERHKSGLLKTQFTQSLGKVAYQVACHQRVQNIGGRTRQILELIPGTEILSIERCTGHDGTYGVRKETYDKSQKINRHVVRQVEQFDPAAYTSDCPMASRQIEHGAVQKGVTSPQCWKHPIGMLRYAYGL